MMSIVGIVLLLAIAIAFSVNRQAIKLRTVIGAFLIQTVIGAFVLYVPQGKDVLLAVSNAVSHVIGYATDGIRFIFGSEVTDKKSLGFTFAFHVLPVIVFFSSLIAVLYHIGVMKWIVRVIGGGLQKALGTSQPESMSAAANIFVGQTEAPLVVKPYIPTMTRSELFAVMVGGLSSVAGSVLAGYAGMGVELKYLIAASFMAAPGGFLMAKLIYPETNEVKDELTEEEDAQQHATNVIDAAASGASNGMMLALNVGAMLLAFVALIAMLNGLFGLVGGLFGYPDFTLQQLFGYVFKPVAFLLGVPWNEAQLAGSFIGQKIVINEFVAYSDFVNYRETLSPVTQVIVTFVLCGFANLSSIAILLGGLGGIAPSRRKDIAELGVKALLAATLANMMSAAIAGLFFSLT